MFARKLQLTIDENGSARPCPLEWMDQFFMRHFTGFSAIDETLPVADGELEAGTRVLDQDIQAHFEKWLRGRRMISAEAQLRVTPQGQAS